MADEMTDRLTGKASIMARRTAAAEQPAAPLPPAPAATARDPIFERKVQASRLALLFERLWPRLWLVLAIVIGFVALSLAGIWPWLGAVLHPVVLGLFALALAGTIVHAARVSYPTREEAIRRIERVSRVPHRPASSYEDTLSAASGNADTSALWQAHKARLAAMLAKLRVGPPSPRADRHDPMALRAALLLSTLALTFLVGDSARDRLAAAFRFGGAGAGAEARVDAWITPPAYTGKPPMMLADGAASGGLIASGTEPLEVPTRSALVVRSSGAATGRLAVSFTAGAGGAAEVTDAPAPKNAGDPIEIKSEIKRSGTLRILSGGTQVGAWTLAVTPDQVPKITLLKKPDPSPRGSMKLAYKVEDDYGVVSAEAKFEKLKQAAPDPAKAWARQQLKGPRKPLERPPVLALRLPRGAGKPAADAMSYLELGQHPWAGLPVKLVLVAKDAAGQVGTSEPFEMTLPGRMFTKPLARAVVEQRRKLIEDSRYRGHVVRSLAALTLAPETFPEPAGIYLSLRDVMHRLKRDKSRLGLKSAQDQLWHIALKIEDGLLSDAEKALKDAQDKLSKALEDGASDQEIQQLMQELKQALNNFLQEMAKQAEGQPQMPDGQNPNQQMMSSQDLERMLKNIENMARNGARDQAQQMLSEMRDMLDRLQSGKMTEQQAQQGREMMQKMDELGNIVGDQQKLMDDTYGEQRRGEQGQQQGRQGQRGQQKGQQQGRGQQGQKGERQPGHPGGQPGEQGEAGERGQKGQQGQGGQGGLGQRQQALREKLDKLQRDMQGLGMGSDKLDAAREAMEGAEQALKQGDLDTATEEQSKALESLREGAKQMAQEMLKNMPQRYGQSGDTPRDPLGRPQKSQGPDLGTSVKVPDEIDMQRAREILEELRRRSGEATRPTEELDYLERLLRRF